MGVSWGQKVRRLKYCEAADEWPIGRTPPNVKEKYDAEVKALDEALSADSSDNDNDGNGHGGHGDHGSRVGPKQGIPALGPRPAAGHPEFPGSRPPPQSADDLPPKPRGRNRRRRRRNPEGRRRRKKIDSERFVCGSSLQREDSAAKNALSNRLTRKRQKRRWTQE